MTEAIKSKALFSVLFVALLCVCLVLATALPTSAEESYNGDISIPIEDLLDPTAIMYGDVNGDGEVGASDVLMLRKYMANYDYDTNTSTITVEKGADANGDGEVGATDVLILRKYMANYDYDTGASTIVLGPKS